MHVKWLSLNNFRLFNRQNIELTSQLNIFLGSNAQGKTSILEALFVCAVGGSFRTAQMNELIRKNSPGFFVDLVYEKCGISQELKVCVSSSEKYVLLNSLKQPLSSLYGGLTCVASTPEDVQLIKGSPSLRRDFLDQQLLQIDPLYNHHLKRYQRALKQRNSLLKLHSVETLESWEFELAHSAAYIMLKRKKTLETLSPASSKIYTTLSNIEKPLTLKYRPGVSLVFQSDNYEEWKELLRNMWRVQRSRDLTFGMTLSGPHKDDFHIILGELELRQYGSEGEQRTAAIALRLAEWEEIYLGTEGETPVLLMDDIGYGLDAHRQKKLVEWLSKAGQVLVTTTELPEEVKRVEGAKVFTLPL